MDIEKFIDKYGLSPSSPEAYYAELASNEVKKSPWISVDDRLPDHDFCHCLAVRHYHKSPDRNSVQYAFFTKDREYARSNNEFYSRKLQGKLSVHFDVAESGFVVTHWMPLPEPPNN